VSVSQPWPYWADELFGGRFYEERRGSRFERPSREFESGSRGHGRAGRRGDVREGGPRPAIAAVAPATIAFPHSFAANSIVIDVGERKLYYVLSDNRAYAYPIGVGREGFGWTGTEPVSRKQAWPDWHPPPEMRERDPSLPEKMTGGLKNPLGAMALYLGNSLYRIHGTNDAKSIGRAESSGCFRMLNSAVLHLASITEIGTPVTVVGALPPQQVSRAPQMRPDTVKPRALPPAPSVATDRTAASERIPDYRSLRDHTLKAK
jgi:lipoprotein-anchoring transpeptidase ErfK/SrfK